MEESDRSMDRRFAIAPMMDITDCLEFAIHSNDSAGVKNYLL